MSTFYLSRRVKGSFDDVEAKVRDELQRRGFGVLTEIPVNEVLKKKLNVDFKRYKILGACNPNFAYQALTTEEHIGVYMPCNVILIEDGDGVEVCAVNPEVTIGAAGVSSLRDVALSVRNLLEEVLKAL